MIYAYLFMEFFKIGLFAFGGAYGAIPLIQEAVLKNGWMDEVMFANMVAVSESTPGPIMVNAATYIGNHQAGFFGALIATTGVVLPSFVIVLLLVALFQRMVKNRKVQMILKGVKPCLMGIITATGLYMTGSMILPADEGQTVDGGALAIVFVLAGILVVFGFKRKKAVSPILLIGVSAVMGCVLFS